MKTTLKLLAAATTFACCAFSNAIIYNEGTSLQAFPATTLAAATNPGTTTVNATETDSGVDDLFGILDLGSGTYTLTATTDGAVGLILQLYSSSCYTNACYITTYVFDSASSLMTGPSAIPATGELYFLLDESVTETDDYSVTVTTSGGASSSAPEPSTAATVAAALALVLFIRRK